jgi:hypothetical protein
MASGGIYLRRGEELVAMIEQPYATEELLQALLADYPSCYQAIRPPASLVAGFR